MPDAPPLTVCEQVPEWVHDAMTDMGYDLMPCSWANALYEWHDAEVHTPAHTVEMFFFNEGKQVRLLLTHAGDTYLNAFCEDDDTDMLQGEIAKLRQQLKSQYA